MSAFTTAQILGKDQIKRRIKEADLYEYGISGRKVIDVLETAIEDCRKNNIPYKIVASLDNCDTKGPLLAILKNNPEKIFEGINIAALLLDNPVKILHIPEFAASLSSTLHEAAEKHSIAIVTGLVDMRSYKGASVHHILTMMKITDMFDGNKESCVYVSVNDSEIKKLPPETKIKSLIEIDKAKAVEIGYNLHPVEHADFTLGEANITNGVIKILTEKDCIVQTVLRNIQEAQTISCGKCVFCREGILQLVSLHKDIIAGKGRTDSLAVIKEIAEAMSSGSFCSLGRKAPEIILSALQCFGSEYEEHIKKKTCSAGQCGSFVKIYIDPEKCTGCSECMDVCPVDCIEGKDRYIHMIDEIDCTHCGKCIETCPEKAVILTSGRVPKLPSRLTKCGRFRM
jgi:fumarate reductase flavoprotein subunit/NADH-quinone oxidoreductase subunit F